MPGDVYHVTTNSDSGPGSLRDAINSAVTNRTVLFDISGTINLLTPLVITNSYLDIAGQTAPGIGITLVAGQMTEVNRMPTISSSVTFVSVAVRSTIHCN